MDAQHSPANPTLSAEDMVLRQRGHDIRDARLLAVLIFLSAIIAAFCLVLTFQVFTYSFTRSQVAAAPQAPPSECSEGKIPSGCPEEQICRGGQCVTPRSSARRCENGALCSQCSCEAPLTCSSQNVCTIQVAPDVCSDPEVLGFLKVLQAKCGDARKCESKDLDKYAVAFDDFYNLVGQFPSTLALHFPDGRPDPLRPADWPSDDESTHYLNRLRPILSELKTADRVILVGLASRDRRKRDPGTVKALTLARLGQAQTFLFKAASSVLSPAEAGDIENKTTFIALGDQRPIDARFYSNLYGNRPIAWSQGIEDQLRALVENDLNASTGDITWRDRTLNQAVFVVPVACKLPAVAP